MPTDEGASRRREARSRRARPLHQAAVAGGLLLAVVGAVGGYSLIGGVLGAVAGILIITLPLSAIGLFTGVIEIGIKSRRR